MELIIPGQSIKMNIDISDIEIKIKLLKTGSILAQVTITLFDIWEEHGWKVLKSTKIHPTFQEEIWIQAPSYKAFGKWREIIFINDRKLYEQVQGKIYDAYYMARTKAVGQESIRKEESVDDPV